MATGRTHNKYLEFYGDGFDLTGYAMGIGPLGITFEEAEGVAFNDAIVGAFPNQGMVQLGTLNGIFDNTATSGLHVVMNGAGTKREIMVPIGIRAAAGEGDPVFVGTFEQLEYLATPTAGDLVSVSIPFGAWALNAASLQYGQVWGDLAHEKSAETGASTAVAVIDHGAQTAGGGYMAYQMFSSNGTATMKIQDAATNSNGNFSDLVSAGELDATSTPKFGIVPLGKTATVERYIRWQLSLNSASTVTFALAFVRGLVE